MKNSLIKQILQASKDQEETLREIVSCQMRSAALLMIGDLLQEEVRPLCGTPFQHKKDQFFHRGGSGRESVIFRDEGFPEL